MAAIYFERAKTFHWQQGQSVGVPWFGERRPATVARRAAHFAQCPDMQRPTDLIGATKNSVPRSSRTTIPLPGFAKLGCSVPIRWAIKAACRRASNRDMHSCPSTSRAGTSPIRSKKNLFMRLLTFFPPTISSSCGWLLKFNVTAGWPGWQSHNTHF
jgi:hypothetical protein